jgi:hypothetical protein
MEDWEVSFLLLPVIPLSALSKNKHSNCSCTRNGVQNGKGVFGKMVMFSPFHKAFRIVSALAPQTVTYIVFGEGKDNYQSAFNNFLEDIITGFNDADRLVVGELVNVFAAATELWGAPRWSRETPLAELSSWPEPVFDD